MSDPGKRNQLRIIGGRWRGRKLDFPDSPGLRPSPDRVRETLFNWLAPVIVDARCLDLFAGSGALGIEAASRGAAESVLVDQSSRVTATLRGHCERLDADQVRVVQQDALTYLRTPAGSFDIVFLDPPFGQGLIAACIALLDSGAWLAPDARIYIEAEPALTLPLPAHWRILRSKRAGQLNYYLAQCPADAPSS